MIELSAVSKSFGSTVAVRGVDLRIAAENTTVLIGPSGCGKSTLLRIMLGLIQPNDGCVEFHGERVTAASAARLRRKMGYVVQDGGLFPHLTARENVTLMPQHLKWDAARIAARLQALASLTHFPTAALDRYPVQLSGGQRQRVGLMRGLMLDPDVLLLDEPLGALDPMVRSRLQAELKSIFEALGKTVVLVTHDLREAAHFAETVVLLRQGCVVHQGSFDSLCHNPAEPFVTEFVNAQRDGLQAEGEVRP